MENEATYEDQNDRFIDKKISNVKSDLIEITHHILENILLKHLKNISIMKSWLTPLSLLIPLGIAKLTASFNESFGIKAPFWNALFCLGIIASIIWLIIVLIKMYRCRNKATIDFLIKEIKNANYEK